MSTIAEQLATLQTNLEAAKQTLADNLTLNHLETTTASTLTEMAESAANVPGTYYQSYIDLVEGSAITDLTIPKNVMQIGDYKYSGITSLGTLTFEEDSICWRIGAGAFDGCTGLTNINWNNITGLTTIGNQAFNYCQSLETLTLPASVQTIGDYAFNYCQSLVTLTLPASIQTIGSYAFARMSSLTALTFEDDSQLTYIGGYAFGESYNLVKAILPEGLVELAESVFRYAYDMTSVVLPSTLTTIGGRCFASNSNLLKVVCNATTAPTLGDSVFGDGTTDHTGCIYIPQGADYSSWTDQVGDWNIVEMGDYDIRIYDSGGTYTDYVYDDRSLPSDGYKDNTDIYGIELGNTITEIPTDCFSGCTNLSSVTMNTTVVPYRAFADNSKITDLTLTSSVTSIGREAFTNCTGLQSVEIPSSVQTIGDNAFQSCTALTSLTFNEGVTSISDAAFFNCTGLTSVTLPASLSAFTGSQNFRNCYSLTEFTALSPNITSIPMYFLYSCESLTSITMYATTCPTLEDYDALGDISSTGVLHVPTGSDYSSWLEILGDGWTVEYFEI